MPRRPHDMRTKKFAVIKSLINARVADTFCALGNGPFCCRIILGLDRAQPSYNLAWFLKYLFANVLIEEPLLRDI